MEVWGPETGPRSTKQCWPWRCTLEIPALERSVGRTAGILGLTGQPVWANWCLKLMRNSDSNEVESVSEDNTCGCSSLHIHTYVHIHVLTHMLTHSYILMHTHLHTYVHTYIPTHIFLHTHTQWHTPVDSYPYGHTLKTRDSPGWLLAF